MTSWHTTEERGRERERDRDRETETERQREIQRERDRETDHFFQIIIKRHYTKITMPSKLCIVLLSLEL